MTRNTFPSCLRNGLEGRRENIRSQFVHYATHQAVDSTYYYKNTLFLSDSIPIAALFEPCTLNTNPYASSNSVFSNTNVKNEDWYKRTVDNVICAFINEETKEFCFARKLNNTYYRGPSSPEGNAVMVVSVALDQLSQVFGSISVTEHSGYALLDDIFEDIIEVFFCVNYCAIIELLFLF